MIIWEFMTFVVWGVLMPHVLEEGYITSIDGKLFIRMILLEFMTFVVCGVLMPSCVGGRVASHPLPFSDGPLFKMLLLSEILSKHIISPDSIYNSNWNPPFQIRFPEVYLIGLVHKIEERKRNKIIQEKTQMRNGYDEKRGHSLLHFGKRNVDERVKLDHKQSDFPSLPRSLPETADLLYVILNKINSSLYHPYQRVYQKRNEGHKMLYFGKRSISKPKTKEYFMIFYPNLFEGSLSEVSKNEDLNENLINAMQPYRNMYIDKNQNSEKKPDFGLNYNKRSYHPKMYFGKRTEKEKLPNHHMMYFGKQFQEQNQPDHHYKTHFRKILDDEKRPDHRMMYFGKRTVDEMRPDHQMMYFGKRNDDDKRSNHQMMYFGKRTEDEKRPDHKMMYFGKRGDYKKRPDYSMMYFGKRGEKEKRSHHRMMYFDKRSIKEFLHNHHMIYLGKRVNKDKPSEKQTVYFSKHPLSEIHPDDEMVYFDVTLDGENQSDLKIVNLGNKVNEEKRANHKMIHFGKRPFYRYDEGEKIGDLHRSLYKRNGHNILYFGKKMRNSEYLENRMNSLIHLYFQRAIPIDKVYNSNDRSLFNHDVSTSSNQDFVSHDMEQTNQPSLFHGNITGKDNLAKTNLKVIPKVMKLLKGYETSAKNYFHLTKRLETRSVNQEKINDVQSKENKYLISAEHLDLAVKDNPNSGDSNTGKIVTGENHKASDHKRVKRSTSNPDGTVADVGNDFTGYEFMPYSEEEDLLLKKWYFENTALFSSRSSWPRVPVLTDKIQEQYPNLQYYFREDRDANRRDEERNAFLHFG